MINANGILDDEVIFILVFVIVLAVVFLIVFSWSRFSRCKTFSHEALSTLQEKKRRDLCLPKDVINHEAAVKIFLLYINNVC